MTRSLSGGVLAGTDWPLMVGLGFPTGYLEQINMPNVQRVRLLQITN
jgi:hypothetical protein